MKLMTSISSVDFPVNAERESLQKIDTTNIIQNLSQILIYVHVLEISSILFAIWKFN